MPWTKHGKGLTVSTGVASITRVYAPAAWVATLVALCVAFVLLGGLQLGLVSWFTSRQVGEERIVCYIGPIFAAWFVSAICPRGSLWRVVRRSGSAVWWGLLIAFVSWLAMVVVCIATSAESLSGFAVVTWCFTVLGGFFLDRYLAVLVSVMVVVLCQALIPGVFALLSAPIALPTACAVGALLAVGAARLGLRGQPFDFVG